MHLSPYVRFAIDQHLGYGWRLPERVIFDYELLYIKEGEVRITVEDTAYHARPGDVFLFRPNRRHSMQPLSSGGFRQPHLHFDLIRQEDSERVFTSFKPPEQLSEEDRRLIRKDILLENGPDLPDKLPVADIGTFDRLLSDVISEFESRLPYAQISTEGAFLRLWAFILRQQLATEASKNNARSALLQDIRRFLHTNAERPLSLEEVASRFHLSKWHLARSFREAFGTSPIQYHEDCRMEKAKNMLLYTCLTVTQIADALGFDGLSAFSRAFKRRYGCTPSAMRRSPPCSQKGSE